MDSSLLAHLSTAVLLLDQNLVISDMNPAAEGVLVSSRRSAVGQHISVTLPHAGVWVSRMQAAVEDGQAWTAREVELPTAHEPARVTVDLTATPLGDPPTQLLLEMSALDRHIRISREASLDAQHDASRALVRGLAHEIKNPLGGLRGAAQLLERRLGEPDLKRYTRVIIDEADRLAALVDDLLGPATLPRAIEVNIHELLERVTELVGIESPGVSILRDYDPSLPMLTADPDHLMQALLNLTRNAVQAVGGSGTVTLRTRPLRRVTISGRVHRIAVGIEIVDDGPGVPQAIQERMFYPLVSARDGGTGLGLPIARALVGRHGGSVEFERRGGETVFSVKLPIEDMHANGTS